MTLMNEKSQLNSEDNSSINTLAINCHYCGEKIKDRDRLVIVDGKVLHDNGICSNRYKNIIKGNKYKIEFPYLTERQINLILKTEGGIGFQTIRDNDWIVLKAVKQNQMMVAGFRTEKEVCDYITTYHLERNNEIMTSIEVIFNNGEKYFHKVNINVVLTLDK